MQEEQQNKARYVLLADDVTKGRSTLGSNKVQLKPANWIFGCLIRISQQVSLMN